MSNLWDELDALPPHHRIAIAAEIIKRDRPSLRMLAEVAGLNPDTFSMRLHRERKEAPKTACAWPNQRPFQGIGQYR